ncbi:MAG: hypothetical protein QM811_26565 [Pirellulales bacterium]
MPQKPLLSPAEPPTESSRGVYGGALILSILLGAGGVVFFSVPALLPIALVVLGPFLLAGFHYLLWGRNWSEKIRAQVEAEEAAEIASGRRRPVAEPVPDEPWLRGEERE